MGKVAYAAAIVFGSFLVLLGSFVLIGSLMSSGFSSWFMLFFSMFIYIISAIVFYAASRAKPRISVWR